MIPDSWRMAGQNTLICKCAVLAGGIFIILVYSVLSFASIQGGSVKLNSPDETANYFFARTLALTGEIGYEEPLTEPGKGVVHPRSMTTAGDYVVPVGFLGLAVIYGSLAKIFGVYAILFFTPIIAVFSAWLLYRFLSPIFPRRVAALSGVLLLVHPAYWYYASRGMLPNILFVDLLLLGMLLLATAYQRGRPLFFAFGGFVVGLALTVRLSEAIWVFAALFLATVVLLGRRFFSAALFFILGCALPLVGLFFLNTTVYGHPFIFGYQSAATYESVTSFDRVLSLVKSFDKDAFPLIWEEGARMIDKGRIYIFPFGFNVEAFTEHFQRYGIGMFWWFSLLTMFGILAVIKKGLTEFFTARQGGLLLYCALSFLVGIWLVIYYGSWTFTDNISEEITIGNSYVRYWLPLYLVSLPFAATTLVGFLHGTKGLIPRTMIVSAIVIVMMFFSGKAVLYEYKDSLLPIAENIGAYHRSAAWIIGMTEPDAVIFSERSDKNFFPERHVAHVFPEFAEAEFLPPLVELAPVYYYGMWDEEDAAYISRRYLGDYGLALEPVARFENGERLYKVVTHEEL